MSGRIKGCFETVEKLRSHNPGVLCKFLEQFPAFLTKFGITLPNPASRDTLPYEELREALMSPEIPDGLAVLLILVGKLGNELGWGEIEREADMREVRLAFDKTEMTYSDRAMMAWILAQPGNADILEESFARARIYSRSSYTYYPMNLDIRDKYRTPGDVDITALEGSLDAYFGVTEQLGTGAKVLKYDYDAEIWFLVRHPGVLRREGVYEKGHVKSLPLSPEQYDAVVYHKKYGDLRINAHRKKEHDRYRIDFGHLLFGEANVFDNTRKIVNLRPLIGDCLAICEHRDIPGLKTLLVSEICFTSEEHGTRRVTWRSKSDNAMLPLDAEHRALPKTAESVIYAKFRYQLNGDTKFKGMTVHTGKALNYERDGDSCVLEEWLRERKFIEDKFRE